jgi:hypothetical protein
MRKELLLASMTLLLSCPLANAAGCLEEVERVAQKMGVMKSLPSIPGMGKGDAPATTESRGIPPEVSSRLTGTGTSSATSAGREGEAVAMLQSARAANAQGNEQECFSQLAKAREKLEGK